MVRRTAPHNSREILDVDGDDEGYLIREDCTWGLEPYLVLRLFENSLVSCTKTSLFA